MEDYVAWGDGDGDDDKAEMWYDAPGWDGMERMGVRGVSGGSRRGSQRLGLDRPRMSIALKVDCTWSFANSSVVLRDPWWM